LSFLPVTITFPPKVDILIAVCFPIPDEAPVTRIVFPVKLKGFLM